MDDQASPSSEENAAKSPAKKTPVKRTRTRSTKTTTKKTPRKSAKKSVGAETSELPLDSAPAPAAAPKFTPTRKPVSAPEPAPATASEPAPKSEPVAPPPAPASAASTEPARSSTPESRPPREAPESSDKSDKPDRPTDRGPADSGRDPQASGRENQGNGHNNGGGGNSDRHGGDDRESRWGNKRDRKGKRGKKGGKWQKSDPRDRPPAQPLPPGMEEVKLGELPNPSEFEDLAALDQAAQSARESSAVPLILESIYPMGIAELGAKGAELGATVEGVPSRRLWMEAIFRRAAEKSLPMWDHGWLDMTDDGYGFIVHPHVSYRLHPENSYVPPSLVKRYGLKRGHEIEVIVRPPREGERCPAVIGVESVMGNPPEDANGVTPFEELEPYYPLERILMESPVHKDISMRAVDLLTPIGFGQRGLIVAPPRTGKTVLMQNMANSVSHNFPKAKLIMLLIDERPEEVTDFKRHTQGEVVSSTFDEAPSNHVHAAEMVIEKARRLVEQGDHVVILLDSVTRLARAYNALASNSGKIMSGGIEATALQKPKRFFGSARNIEGKGSLTILGTALIDTNSRMDEVIFEEFKGTGNMELHLDRGLSDKRIFPAINIDRSGTRKEELIYHPAEMERVYGLRRAMQGIPPVEAMEMFIKRLRKTKTNAEFLMSLKS
ncbi:transcription termination factor Rho [Synoicihabitans lomoniglobus]|uniref:Transcription termination factor Rho n=1 Tax=Synoicihabitans lomoniglobus TaxID=2909285 RepID=A0AAF0CSG3_9BACT|nr:transcription termination factor Rho [Opitutaceae bacterium LMO-M01]WED67203.1 transcription termination factor Rho [Opitutaceae bacterium LMO-M01]